MSHQAAERGHAESGNQATEVGGRPRDERIDDAVIAATTALLEEVGYSGTTVKAVARRCGVGTPAIYRRWASRVELIEAAVFPTVEVGIPVPTGELVADLQAYVDVMTSVLSRPAARAAFPGLLAEYVGAPDRYEGVTLRVGLPIREAFHELLTTQPTGSVDPTLDSDSLLDLLAASVLYEQFVLPFTGRPAHGTSTAEIIAKALRCGAATGRAPKPPTARKGRRA